MKEAIEQIQKELADLKAASLKEVEDIRVRFLGKKGCVTALMEQFRTVAVSKQLVNVGIVSGICTVYQGGRYFLGHRHPFCFHLRIKTI